MEAWQGTTFEINLLRIEDGRAKQSDVDTPVQRGTERILFVDDEKALAEMAKSALERLGYSVQAVTSSVEALELFKARTDYFDLVITDYTMLHMTGVDLAWELMRVRPGIPVILCTGFTERITEEEVRRMGIRKFALKPLGPRDLSNIIRKCLG